MPDTELSPTPKCPDQAVLGGTDLAVIIREGGEAEARRAVGSLPLLQFAINNAFCGFLVSFYRKYG